jgi:hypothetical protein
MKEQLEKTKPAEVQIVKALEPVLKQVTYVAMQEGTDLHFDYVSAEDVRLAKESFNRQLRKARMSNLYHLVQTDSFDILESYLAPCDMVLSGHLVRKGTWLVTLSIEDDKLWDMIVNDEITGVSIGAIAQVENLE